MTKVPGTLVLASESRYRRELLDRVGLSYQPAAHRCDENAYKATASSPEALARELARQKALSLAETFPAAWILGSDQVAELEGKVLDKPGTVENAVAQLMSMQGKPHRLITAVALRCPDGRVLEACNIHTLWMRVLDHEEARRYVERDMPLDCCGSFKIEGMGMALFSKIEGSDYTGIIGLPLLDVLALLRKEGWVLP